MCQCRLNQMRIGRDCADESPALPLKTCRGCRARVVVEEGIRGMSLGAMQSAYPLLSALAALCAAVCGRMLVVAEREGLISQAWLAAVCFVLWSALAAVYFLWGAV
jgi:hypothetical protein